LFGLGGYGDLLASMSLPDRPEVVLGRELANGASLEEAQTRAKLRIEAIELVPRIARFAQKRGVHCEVFTALSHILEGSVDVEELVTALLSGG
jgi:glycerol-3-phosphate dehydrogenase (NAD(P)+)